MLHGMQVAGVRGSLRHLRSLRRVVPRLWKPLGHSEILFEALQGDRYAELFHLRDLRHRFLWIPQSQQTMVLACVCIAGAKNWH